MRAYSFCCASVAILLVVSLMVDFGDDIATIDMWDTTARVVSIVYLLALIGVNNVEEEK